jgi:hypothetical protein
MGIYSLLDYSCDNSVLRFTYATAGIEEHDWHYAALVHPTVDWFEDVRHGLAGQHKLTVEAALERISELAAIACVPITAVDWLGLALFALQSYREAAGRLAASNSPEAREECLQFRALSDTFAEIADQFSTAVQDRLSRLPADAA